MAASQVSFWDTREFKKEVYGKLLDTMSPEAVRTGCYSNGLISKQERNSLKSIADPGQHNETLLEFLEKLPNEQFCEFRDEVLASDDTPRYVSILQKMVEIEEKYDKVTEEPSSLETDSAAKQSASSGKPSEVAVDRTTSPWIHEAFKTHYMPLLLKIDCNVLIGHCYGLGLFGQIKRNELQFAFKNKGSFQAAQDLLAALEKTGPKGYARVREVLRHVGGELEFEDILVDLDRIGPDPRDPDCLSTRQKLKKTEL